MLKNLTSIVEWSVNVNTREQLVEIVRVQDELKQLAKRLEYYDDDDEMKEDESLEQHREVV